MKMMIRETFTQCLKRWVYLLQGDKTLGDLLCHAIRLIDFCRVVNYMNSVIIYFMPPTIMVLFGFSKF
ncbi:hypothetical protein BRADI_3g50715v3 [Brachypodium distachyon]|uniref:Uncharacterized protein n=1 Tax=Brachypodium distachyon TaxID=15368 RepID=A0A2K2D4G3_BRADI|nr:hypothetical protein BRADI_3g50715v3 [Brachypodium distachyon]